MYKNTHMHKYKNLNMGACMYTRTNMQLCMYVPIEHVNTTVPCCMCLTHTHTHMHMHMHIPQAFCACIYRRPHRKCLWIVEQDSVQQEALACSIHAHHAHCMYVCMCVCVCVCMCVRMYVRMYECVFNYVLMCV